MSEVEGCILRIATREWVNQVFSMAIYYTNMHRKWRYGQTVLFVHRTGVGDAVVGYGVVDRACEKDELSEEDRRLCERGGWKRAVEFRYVKQFDKPLPVKDTFLRSSKLRGRCFHGFRLGENKVRTILAQAEAKA